MTILGIETSCDETSAAVVADGVLSSNITAAQLFHAEHGGVVPELASRAHLRKIVPIVEQALSVARVRINQLDAIAAVSGPGLVGSLLVGLSFGKALAYALGKPFVAVNHMEAHILSNLLESKKPSFPFVNLTVSGGHTQLVLVKAPFDHVLLGETADDAAGEAFDKVAKMLGLEYPGGPVVDKRARNGDPNSIQFPRPSLDQPGFSFSFSGLKTSVLYYLRDTKYDPDTASTSFVDNVCAAFQAAVVDVLLGKLFSAANMYNVTDVCLAGGVTANSSLRKRASAEAERRGLQLFVPRLEFCTDNGAMVAMAGYLRLREGRTSSLEITAEPNLALTST